MLKQFQTLYQEADKNRLVRSVVRAASGGAVATALAGVHDLKIIAGGAATGAGAAFLNFIQKPTKDKSEGSSSDGQDA